MSPAPKDKHFRKCRKFTDHDEEFIESIRRMIRQGTMAKKTAQTIKKEFEKTVDPLEMLAILRKNVRVVHEEGDSRRHKTQGAREVILSAYQVAGA